jgi:hypothetical protein
MTTPQPPAPQYIYVQRPPTDVVGVFAWVAGIFAILCIPAWTVPFGLLPLAVFLLAVCLTIAARAGKRRSAHSTAALVLLVVALAFNVLAAIAISQ